MSTPSSDEARIATRYGRGPRRRPGILLTGLVIALIAIVGWFGWALWAALHPEVSSGLEKWEAVSENEVEVTFVVRLHDQDVEPVCTVEAEDDREETVGRLEFTAGEGRQTVTIPTERRALRVEWGDCTVE
ncbi:hypothetical protein J2S40_000385 [Nocardioides luteus]|uniref:DUF4307 domain-containing protein n=1 Tax=Nocardioides luteus TaxID=1844 RepID=UPI001664A8BA|nr:DUF4307 domain-containing protein [Nocardioides luteus]MDR7309327.1 hypothetical protein [Nocardioides luteus]